MPRPSKELERLFLDRMLKDLNWSGMQVYEGAEPPDFLLDPGNRRIAAEITRVYGREGSKGSPEAAQERVFEQFVSALAHEYFKDEAPQPIQVTVTLPPILRGPEVRPRSREERRADAAAVTYKALARLRHLPKLGPWQEHQFRVHQRDGRSVTFHVLGLPAGTGLERRWDVMNNTVGWVGGVDGHLLQQKIDDKAQDLPKYRPSVGSALLLVVADGSRASGFLELPPDVAVDPHGFDTVYFQSFERGTQQVPLIAEDAAGRTVA